MESSVRYLLWVGKVVRVVLLALVVNLQNSHKQESTEAPENVINDFHLLLHSCVISAWNAQPESELDYTFLRAGTVPLLVFELCQSWHSTIFMTLDMYDALQTHM